MMELSIVFLILKPRECCRLNLVMEISLIFVEVYVYFYDIPYDFHFVIMSSLNAIDTLQSKVKYFFRTTLCWQIQIITGAIQLSAHIIITFGAIGLCSSFFLNYTYGSTIPTYQDPAKIYFQRQLCDLFFEVLNLFVSIVVVLNFYSQ